MSNEEKLEWKVAQYPGESLIVTPTLLSWKPKTSEAILKDLRLMGEFMLGLRNTIYGDMFPPLYKYPELNQGRML